MRSIIVTGGFGVLGRAVAQAFREQGDRVARVDFAGQAADSNPGGIDVLVNVAGGFVSEPLADGGPSNWARMFAMNAGTCVTMTKAALPVLTKTPGAAIVNIGAGSALVAGAGMGGYAASKAAVHKLTESLAAELAGTDCTVNAVAAEHHRHADQPRRHARRRCFAVGPASLARQSHRVLGKPAGPHHLGRADPGIARRIK